MKKLIAYSIITASLLGTLTAQNDKPTSIVGTTNSMDVLDGNRRLTVGDLLSYRVVEDRSKQISRLLVTDSGEVEVPLIGRVYAQGKSCKSLALEIKAILEEQYYNKATVIIGLDFTGRSNSGGGGPQAAASAGKITIMGSIARQGKLDLPPKGTNYTLSEAILDAGGFTRFAKSSKVKVVRTSKDGSRKNYIVNMDDVMKKGELDKDLVLQPNDYIIIRDKFFNF